MSCLEASDDLEAAIAQVIDDCTPIAITRERGEGAVLVSASAWVSIEATMYLLRSPGIADRLLGLVREFGHGDEGLPPLRR